LIGVTVFIAHLPALVHRLLDGDEAIYGSIAALMNLGGQLYGQGGVDNKPPGVFWVYAATFRVFGTYQMTAVHVAGLVAMAATCVLIFMIGRDLASTRVGLTSALLYGLLTAAGNPRLLASNTEIFMMLPPARSGRWPPSTSRWSPSPSSGWSRATLAAAPSGSLQVAR
jgi:hypothetical protein